MIIIIIIIIQTPHYQTGMTNFYDRSFIFRHASYLPVPKEEKLCLLEIRNGSHYAICEINLLGRNLKNSEVKKFLHEAVFNNQITRCVINCKSLKCNIYN